MLKNNRYKMAALGSMAYFAKDLFFKRKLIFELARNDFKTKYLGSYLGIIWAFLQPSVTIFILWFVFQVGFRSAPVNDVPFILWLMTGMVPWFFFAECLPNSTNSVVGNSYLVQKVVFSVGMLPIVKILSSLVVHTFFVFFLISYQHCFIFIF